MFDHSVTISNELVTLEPMYLDKRIFEHIRQKLKATKIGICTKEYGFIKDIEIKNVQPAEISMADGGTRFSTTYSIHSLKPKSGNVYTCKNVIVIDHNNVCCVISTIDDTCENKPFQIFIINGTCKGEKYIFTDCKCAIPATGKPTDFILPNIVVDTVEYHENQFIVTGKHIHNHKVESPSSKHDKEVCAKTG